MRSTRAALPLAIGAAAIALALVTLAAFSMTAIARGGFAQARAVGSPGCAAGSRRHMLASIVAS
ncbi:MAG: hypothetical protein KGK07_05645 [Chloroflexota bacterium]|nr:hypothetical protein [Chloroflexota bacterium]